MNQLKRGQAVIEFIAFFPFMIVLYFVLLAIGNSINSGINQQKITRGYYYNIVHNDSYVNTKTLLSFYYSSGVTRSGMLGIGWAQSLDGETPIATCFKVVKQKQDGFLEPESCISKIQNRRSSSFIRPKTVYGVCGESFATGVGNFWNVARNIPGNSVVSAHVSSCLNIRN